MERAALRIRARETADRSPARRPGGKVFPYLTTLLALLVLPQIVLGENPDAVTDSMSDRELRAFRKRKVAELRHRARHFKPAKTADIAIYPEIFYCTIYYTPKESGFTTERGFDVKRVTARGLGGRKYPRSFLHAVRKEGYGHLINAVNGRRYIRYVSWGRYAFAEVPLGRRGEVLVPRKSCAISSHNPFLRQHDHLTIVSPTVNGESGRKDWFVCDTGGGVQRLQIDLYWGEDEPRGAVGRQPARPAGTWMEYAFQTTVAVRR